MCRYKINTALIILLLFFAACKKDKLMTYEGVRSLHFKMQDNSTDKLDSIPVNLAYLPDEITDITVEVLVELMGPILDDGLEYEVEIDAENTSLPQSSYSFEGKYIFPRGKNVDTIRINLKEIAQGRVEKLALRLKSNSNFQNDTFQTSLSDNLSNRLQFYFSNVLEIPTGWSTDPLGDLYVGVFSKKKLLLLSELAIQITGDDMWTAEKISSSFMVNRSSFGSFLNDYLQSMREKGTPVLEKNGSLMKAGPYFD